MHRQSKGSRSHGCVNGQASSMPPLVLKGLCATVVQAPVQGRLRRAGASFYLFFFKRTWNLRNVNLKQMAGDIQLLFEGSPGWGDALPHQNCHSCCSVAQSCPTLFDRMDCSTSPFPVHHRLPEFTQTHVHRVGNAIQPSHPLLSPSSPAFNPSPCQGLF